MAILRDSRTSAAIAVGTPLEMVLLADELGRGEVLFDDVGQAFDPDAVLEAHQANKKGLTAARKGERNADTKASIDAALEDRKAAETRAAELVPRARQALEEARRLAD